MRLHELYIKPKVHAFHASTKHNVQIILADGFRTNGGVVWFNSDPNIGIDDETSYIISVDLDIQNPWRMGDTDVNYDPDIHSDVEHMIQHGYDAWFGDSNIGVGDDIVVFSISQIHNIQYYGRRTVDDDYNVSFM